MTSKELEELTLPDPERRRVLVCEDSDSSAQVVKGILNKVGITRVDLAPDGAIAWEKIQESLQNHLYYDFAVVDWRMPHLNGLKLLERIRMIREPYLPVIFLTAVSDKISILQAARLEVDGYLVKPIAPNDLIRKINSLIVAESI